MSCWYYIGLAAAFLAGAVAGAVIACDVIKVEEDNEEF